METPSNRWYFPLGVELSVNGLDALEDRTGQLDRRERTTPDELLRFVDGQMK